MIGYVVMNESLFQLYKIKIQGQIKHKKERFEMKRIQQVCGVMWLLALLCFMGCGQRQAEKRNIGNEATIGVLSFMTGEYAPMGIDILNGALWAKEVFEQRNTNIFIRVFVEDGKGEAKASASAFNKLLLKKPDAIVAAGANQIPVVAPVAVHNKIPMLATVIPNSNFLSLNGKKPLLFRNFVSSSGMASKIAQYAVNNLHLKTAACLMIRAEIGEESEKSFTAEFTRGGGKILERESFDENMSNVKSVVVKMIATASESIYVVGYGTAYTTILNQIRELGYRGIILTNDAVNSPETLKYLRSREKIYYSNLDMSVTDEHQSILKGYKKKHQREMSTFAIYGFTTMAMMLEAIEYCHKENTEISNALLNANGFKTVTGLIKFNTHGDCVLPVIITALVE